MACGFTIITCSFTVWRGLLGSDTCGMRRDLVARSWSVVGFRKWAVRYRSGLTVGSAVVVVVAFIVVLLRGAAWLYGPGLRRLTPDQQAIAIDDMRGRLIQVGAGLLAAGALVYTALNFRLSREGHVTDRYQRPSSNSGPTAWTCGWARSMRWSAS
jgi:hypothetical protein